MKESSLIFNFVEFVGLLGLVLLWGGVLVGWLGGVLVDWLGGVLLWLGGVLGEVFLWGWLNSTGLVLVDGGLVSESKIFDFFFEFFFLFFFSEEEVLDLVKEALGLVGLVESWSDGLVWSDSLVWSDGSVWSEGSVSAGQEVFDFFEEFNFFEFFFLFFLSEEEALDLVEEALGLVLVDSASVDESGLVWSDGSVTVGSVAVGSVSDSEIFNFFIEEFSFVFLVNSLKSLRDHLGHVLLGQVLLGDVLLGSLVLLTSVRGGLGNNEFGVVILEEAHFAGFFVSDTVDWSEWFVGLVSVDSGLIWADQRVGSVGDWLWE